MAKMEHAVELLDKLGDVCETVEEAEQMVHWTLVKAEVEILKTAAKRRCSLCRENYKIREVDGRWRHDSNILCPASDILSLILEITGPKPEIPT